MSIVLSAKLILRRPVEVRQHLHPSEVVQIVLVCVLPHEEGEIAGVVVVGIGMNSSLSSGMRRSPPRSTSKTGG